MDRLMYTRAAMARFFLTVTSFMDHMRLRDLPAQLNAFLLSEAIRGIISPPWLCSK